MSIIFNEEEYAKKIMENGIQNNKRKYYDLQTVAIYLRNLKKKDKEIEDELHKISKMSFPDYNKVRMSEGIEARVKRSKEKKLKTNPPINITQKEIEIILSEDERKIRNLMFVLLVLAKYYMSNSDKKIEKYYITYNDVDIFKLCDIFVKKDERLELMYYLSRKKYITPTSQLSFSVNYVYEDSSPVLSFRPDIDMVYYFEEYLGGIFIRCENCGKLVKKTNNKIKYCKECAKLKKDESQEKRYKVYVLTNTINGKQYVGRTGQSLKSRFCNGEGYRNNYIYYDIQKYGWDKFKHELIRDGLTKDESYELEKEIIKKLDTQYKGYNIACGGNNEDCYDMMNGSNEKKFTTRIRKKKKEFHNGMIYYDSIKEDDNRICYCIEEDAYFKGIKTLCKVLSVERGSMENHILYSRPFGRKNFIRTKNQYDTTEITDDIKKELQEQILHK